MMFPNTSILDPDNGPTGFTTPDFQFAAIPCGNQYMIIAEGQQLEVVDTRQLAEIRLEQLKNSHRVRKTGTKTPVQPKSQKKTKTPSGRKGSGGAKPTNRGGSPKKPKSKGVTVKKPHTLHPNPLMDALS
jgi:hypothetical protein